MKLQSDTPKRLPHYIGLVSTNQISPWYHVEGVTLGDRGYPPLSLTERELDPNRERLGSNLRASIKETRHTTLATFTHDWNCLSETDGKETTR